MATMNKSDVIFTPSERDEDFVDSFFDYGTPSKKTVKRSKKMKAHKRTTARKSVRLSDLKEGDKFRFVSPICKSHRPWVVEGQYKFKRKTTIYSLDEAKSGHEPILVENYHRVILLEKKAYTITHNVQKRKQ